MAKLYADNDGRLLRLLKDEVEERRFPAAPSGTTTTIEFDEEENASVLQALAEDWNSHAVSGGVLVRNHLPVALAENGQGFQDERAVTAILLKLRNDQSLTAAELRILLRSIVRSIRNLSR
jgi:hypothetical protein